LLHGFCCAFQPVTMATQPAADYPFYIVDAFTKRLRRGNPAAVVLLTPEPLLSDSDMQSVAAEFNLSETAFVFLASGSAAPDRPVPLRWFTPKCEVALCGHATLAAATAVHLHLRASGRDCDRLEFDTMSGLLPVTRDAATGQWSLDFPLGTVEPIAMGDRDASAALLESALGDELGVNSVLSLAHSPDRQKLLIELKPEARDQFLRLRPDTAAMVAAAPTGQRIRGVIVTVSGEGFRERDGDDSGEFDFLSRYFAPWVGIPEDPVTGAAHTVLAAYWRAKLGGRDEMLAKQCSRRGGVLRLRVDAGRGRVALTGHSVMSAHGRVAI
uniref:PhzF family phenazine biosynthesis protein n=2 Tax=Macrostomum lignano TaxID=282301 RepID=A0A1I8GEF7_9PLAT